MVDGDRAFVLGRISDAKRSGSEGGEGTNKANDDHSDAN